jgi:hypothetical protein
MRRIMHTLQMLICFDRSLQYPPPDYIAIDVMQGNILDFWIQILRRMELFTAT